MRPLIRTSTRLPALLASSCLALGACSDDETAAPNAAVDWQPCADTPTLDCGVLEVPLIHDAPGGRTMAIDLVRLPATGDGETESLVLNPGGPGESGTELLRDFAEEDALPTALRARYDVIGFDPRGIGASDRIDCAQYGIDDSDPYPRDREAIESLIVETRGVADDCVAEYGDRLQWVGSNAVVRDMEAIRVAIDAPALNFIGYSYGTRLAALYLQRYPMTAGRFVLDGSLLPDGELKTLLPGQLGAEQRNLDRLLSICGTTVPGCDPDEIGAAVVSRLESALDEEDELAFELFGTLLVEAVEEPAFGDIAAPVLIDYALDGDLDELLAFAEMFESEDDTVVVESGENATVNRAVLCADDATRPTIDSLLGTLTEFNGISDLFAEAEIAFAASCAGWPEALDPVVPIVASSAPVSLVIGGSTDAQTPIEWAPVMAEAIGGVFLASDHDGHTSVFNGESECVDTIALAFLVDGSLPVEASCPADDGAAESAR